MGYTHYWNRELSIPSAKFEAIKADFERIVLPLHDAGIQLGNGCGADLPVIDSEEIVFNGLAKCGHPMNSDISIPWPAAEAGGVGPNHKAEVGSWFAGVKLDTRC